MFMRVAVGGASEKLAVLHNKGDTLLAAPISLLTQHSQCAEGMIRNRGSESSKVKGSEEA